ncbi:formate/nitrite transporter superfamily protein [Clostridium botulinum B str. Osaka05]|uniref:Formate/nitrite transporter superfamily protein n=1 Tax=Clostridium botulinum B str. Osaka05 TaxID=1407017 RepID=A0A060N8L8_CLOBO|nr:formate/nitrite transporter family protein [Clostridium botulinum]BAO04788.1 formate/nitrite transporter superfamily protein [Clostridium botulinum B str. Osaka05]
MNKLKQTLLNLLNSVMVGIYISIGCISYLLTDNKLVGSTLFVIGLFLVMNFSNLLYTRLNPLLPFAQNKKEHILLILQSLIGNFIGAYITAYVCNLTRLNIVLQAKAYKLVQLKVTDTNISLFILAVFCGVLVGYGVLLSLRQKYLVDKTISILIPVVVFVFCGFEHSIADMFYISCGQMWNKCTIIKISVIIIGNFVGGYLVGLIDKLLHNTK